MLASSYKLIQEDSVLVAQPMLIQHYGRVGALLIQQIHYWSQKSQGRIHNNQRWIHNTMEQWADQLCVSAKTIQRTVKKLTQDGIIHVQKLAKHKSNQTNSYTLNHERLCALVKTIKPIDENCVIERSNELRMDEVQIFKTNKNPHMDKMSKSTRQSVPMVIQKITNKDKNNKSDGSTVQGFAYPQKETSKDEALNEQVLQVENIIDSFEEDKKVMSSSITKTTTAQDMIDIWNKEVSINKKIVNYKLSREISKYLVASYKYKFNEDLDAWKHYCRLLTSSPYLMGKDFVLSLSWVLKFGTIDRILAGELGVQLRGLCSDPERAKSEEDGRTEALRHIDGVGESEGCKEARRAILAALGSIQYNAWFTKVDISDNGATLKPHNRFVEDYIAGKFGHVLDRING